MSTFLAVIILLLIFIVIIPTSIQYSNEIWWTFNRHKNFPFTWHGKTLWYSRSVAVVLFAFCKNANNEWCVLANKRGKGTPDFQGYWNCPTGYLNWNENSPKGAFRECKEETGLEFPLDKIIICGVNSDPTENHQNVVVYHKVVLDDTISNWSSFSKMNMEGNEVDDIQWIPISKLNDYNWAFNHKNLILQYTPINK